MLISHKMRLIGSVLGLLLCLVRPAHPDEPHPDPDEDIARRHFRQGADHFAAGDYAGAIDEFRAAQLVKPLPALEYNIARCLDRLERYHQAILSYERYIAAVASSPASRGEVEELRKRITLLSERLKRLDRRAAGQKMETVPPTEPTHEPPLAILPSPQSAAHPKLPLKRPLVAPALATTALAVALAATGLGLWGAAHQQYLHLSGTCSPSCDPMSWSGLDSQERIGGALLLSSAVLGLGSAVLWGVTIWRRTELPTAWVTPTVNGLLAGAQF